MARFLLTYVSDLISQVLELGSGTGLGALSLSKGKMHGLKEVILSDNSKKLKRLQEKNIHSCIQIQ